VPPDADPPADEQRSIEPEPSASTVDEATDLMPADSEDRHMPRWMLRAIVLFWMAFLAVGLLRHLWDRLDSLILLLLISLFLALAIEPGVNRLARRGWRRGRATGAILLGVIITVGVFIGAIGALVTSQIVDLLENSETYVRSKSSSTLSRTTRSNCRCKC
jgi:predicted PurR-regulated permease PerM